MAPVSPKLTFVVLIGLVISITSAGCGYSLGARRSAAPPVNTIADIPCDTKDLDNKSDASDHDEEEVADGDLAAVKPSFLKPSKLVCRCNSSQGSYFDSGRPVA